MPQTLPPHHGNVPGDFYVEDGCCTLCEIPMVEAPKLFSWWPNAESPEQCVVTRQPQTDEEFDHMLDAVHCAELDCIRYRGKERRIQSRLVELGEGSVCDNLPDDLQSLTAKLQHEYRLRLAMPLWRRILGWLRGDT